MRTMPFGATHSVYCFLRLARSLFTLAVRGLYLMTTNFYDDFILAAQPGLTDSCKNSMELLFMLTGWLFAKEGKKATSFAMHCKALGVEFDFNKSEQRLLAVANTEARKTELKQQLEDALKAGKLEKQLCLVLRGKLGFADSFLHGRLGKLVLKKLIDHAYGRTSVVGEDLRQALCAMVTSLKQAKPKEISVNSFSQWFIYTDASFEPESATGSLGGVLVDAHGKVKFWFGLMLDADTCRLLGAGEKGAIIYELELLASILALSLWHGDKGDELNVHFGDNDGVRFSLIKATAAGTVGQLLMEYHLRLEALAGSRFSDAQRIEMTRMVLTTCELRGIIWRSKTTTLGMPFGAINSGLLSKGAHSWIWKYIRTLDELLHQNGVPDVDFLLPHCDADAVQLPWIPMTYATALLHLRRLIHCPWRSSSNPMLGLDLNFTLHSLKATLLSWGPQVATHTNPEQRLQQGHHVSQSSSLAVYSRDNVWGALEFQRQIIQQVRSGWRPQIAQHRGSQRPLQEPAVTLEILPDYTFQWFDFGSPSALELDPPEQLEEQDQDSDSSSSTSSSSDEEDAKPIKSDEGAAAQPKPSGKKGIFPETLVYGQYRCVVHAMTAADESAHWIPQRDGVHLKPACGRPMKSNGKLLDCVTAEHQLCQHAACRKFWAHFNLECDT
eukprot:s4_g52.t1